MKRNRYIFCTDSIWSYSIIEPVTSRYGRLISIEEIAAKRANLCAHHEAKIRKQCRDVLEETGPDYDEIFANLYAVSGNKKAHIEMWALKEDAGPIMAAIKRAAQPAE